MVSEDVIEDNCFWGCHRWCWLICSLWPGQSSVKDIFTALISLSHPHNVNQYYSCRCMTLCVVHSIFCIIFITEQLQSHGGTIQICIMKGLIFTSKERGHLNNNSYKTAIPLYKTLHTKLNTCCDLSVLTTTDSSFRLMVRIGRRETTSSFLYRPNRFYFIYTGVAQQSRQWESIDTSTDSCFSDLYKKIFLSMGILKTCSKPFVFHYTTEYYRTNKYSATVLHHLYFNYCTVITTDIAYIHIFVCMYTLLLLLSVSFHAKIQQFSQMKSHLHKDKPTAEKPAHTETKKESKSDREQEQNDRGLRLPLIRAIPSSRLVRTRPRWGLSRRRESCHNRTPRGPFDHTDSSERC